jgi:hypothetical protein
MALRKRKPAEANDGSYGGRVLAAFDAATSWRCFHCDEAFTDYNAARDHFGDDAFYRAACLIKREDEGLLGALRNAERELARYRAEDSEKDREFHCMRADHAVALRREEERGYERGLKDGRALAES